MLILTTGGFTNFFRNDRIGSFRKDHYRPPRTFEYRDKEYFVAGVSYPDAYGRLWIRRVEETDLPDEGLRSLQHLQHLERALEEEIQYRRMMDWWRKRRDELDHFNLSSTKYDLMPAHLWEAICRVQEHNRTHKIQIGIPTWVYGVPRQ